MERRKFVLGVGALAAGGAAAMGSGAFSSAQAQRDISVDIAGDKKGYTRIFTQSDAGEFVEYDDNGEVRLVFDKVEGSSGKAQGLNADSVYYFDNLLRIENYSPSGAVGYYFDRESVPDEITFYNGGDGPEPNDYYNITADSLEDAGGSGGNSILDSQVTDTSYNEQTLLTDVQIDLRGSGRGAGDVLNQTDTIELVAKSP